MRGALAWLSLTLLVRGATALALPHPGFIDATYTVHVAGNLLARRGLTESVVWTYVAPPPPRRPPAAAPPAPAVESVAAVTAGALPRPSNAYWPPGTALFTATGAALIPPVVPLWRRLQLFPLLGAAALVVGTYAMARRLAPGAGSERRASLAAGLVLGGGLYFPFWVTTDSFTPFALLGGGCLWLSVRAGAESNPQLAGRRLFAAGVLAGAAQWVRADGLLLLVGPLFAAIAGGRSRGQTAAGVALALAGASPGVFALVLRSLLTWGAAAPPGAAGAIWLTAYDDLFRFGDAPTFERWLAAGLGPALRDRAEATLLNLGVLGQPLLYYTAPLTALGLWRSRRRDATRVPLAYLVALFGVMSLLFPFQGPRGGLFHSLAALVPWLALWTVQGLEVAIAWGARRRGWREGTARDILGTALVALTLLTGLYFTVELRVRWEDRRRAYEAAGAWLTANAHPAARIMAVDAPGAWYATGRDAVATPSDGADALLAAARTYGVEYVLLQPLSPPYLAPVYDGPATLPGLAHVADAGPLRIYRVSSG